MTVIEIDKIEPATCQKAIKCIDSKHWIALMKEKMNFLYKYHTWIMVNRLNK